MNTKPRQNHQATETHVAPTEDRQSAIVLIETDGPIDFALRMRRETLVELLRQSVLALEDQAPHAGE